MINIKKLLTKVKINDTLIIERIGEYYEKFQNWVQESNKSCKGSS